MRRRYFLLSATTASALTLSTPTSWASSTVPLKIIVPYAAGGSTDAIARILAQSLSEDSQQTVLVENRPGASGNIGSAAVAFAKPDSPSLLFNGIAPLCINSAAGRPMAFDLHNDLVPVSMVTSLPTALMVNAALPINTIGEFIAYAKAHTEKVAYGTPGVGTLGHMSAELFSARTGIRMTSAAYRGSAAAITDLIGGAIQAASDNIAPYIPHIESGRIRALAVMTAKRSHRLPDVPTMAEAGVPDFDFPAVFAIWAPKATAAATVKTFNELIHSALRKPEVIAKLEQLAVDPYPSSPEALRQRMRYEEATFAEILKRSGIKLD